MPVRKRSRSVGRRAKRVMRRRFKKRNARKVSWQRKAATLMSDRVSSKIPCKNYRQTSSTVTNPLPAGNMLFSDMTFIPGLLPATGFGDKGVLPQMRIMNMISIRGWKINLTVRSAVTTNCVYFHWAIIRSKDTTTTSLPFKDFFREFNSSRDLDFNAPLNAQVYNNLPINPDRFIVMTHKKVLLERANSGNDFVGRGAWGVSIPSGSWARISFWQPFKKAMVYDDDAANPSNERPIFLAMWCAEPSTDGVMDKIADRCRVQVDVVCKYREKVQ